MLGKLLKYEMKATARLFLPLYLTILIFSVINRFFFAFPDANVGSFSLKNIATSISMFVYISLMIGLVFMTLIVMIQRFYKSLLGDEGYLMFTLPVKSHSHIISKLTVSMLWTIVSSIIGVLSIFIIFSKEIFTPEAFKELSFVWNQLMQYLGASTYYVGIEILLLFLLSVASGILTIYASIALGHLFSKYKLLASFGMFLVIKTVSQIFMTLFAFIFMNQTIFGLEKSIIPSLSQVNSILVASIILFGTVTAGFYILTDYILKRKLNLE